MSEKDFQGDPSAAQPSGGENLTVTEVARRYGMYRKTVLKLLGESVFPGAFRVARGKTVRWKIPAADLAAFVPRQRGGQRTAEPSKPALDKRGNRARRLIAASHGYGQKDFARLIAQGRAGASAQEIAERFDLAEKLVADLLDHAARRRPPKIKPPSVARKLKRVPKKLLIRLYVVERLPIREISEKLGLCPATFYVNLRHYGIAYRDDRLRRSAAEHAEELRRMVSDQSLTPEMIADRLHLTLDYVKKKIRDLKLPPPPPPTVKR